MKLLLTIHHGLQAIGRGIGQITRLVLMLLLFAAPIFALLFASLVAVIEVEKLVGGGALVWFPLFLVFVGGLGFYVAPHVQPQISKAIVALTQEN